VPSLSVSWLGETQAKPKSLSAAHPSEPLSHAALGNRAGSFVESSIAVALQNGGSSLVSGRLPGECQGPFMAAFDR
jgi:hypothetical protein